MPSFNWVPISSYRFSFYLNAFANSVEMRLDDGLFEQISDLIDGPLEILFQLAGPLRGKVFLGEKFELLEEDCGRRHLTKTLE